MPRPFLLPRSQRANSRTTTWFHQKRSERWQSARTWREGRRACRALRISRYFFFSRALSAVTPEPQRGSILQPRVGPPADLPWVTRPKKIPLSSTSEERGQGRGGSQQYTPDSRLHGGLFEVFGGGAGAVRWLAPWLALPAKVKSMFCELLMPTTGASKVDLPFCWMDCLVGFRQLPWFWMGNRNHDYCFAFATDRFKERLFSFHMRLPRSSFQENRHRQYAVLYSRGGMGMFCAAPVAVSLHPAPRLSALTNSRTTKNNNVVPSLSPG